MAGDGLREAAVEQIQRAMAKQSRRQVDALGIAGGHAIEEDWRPWQGHAEAALTALLALLDQRGFVVVPKVATEEMLRAGFSRFLPWGTSIELWRDQLAAAPNPLEAPDGQ